MVRAWQRLASGDFKVRMDMHTGDERDDLVAAFNETVPKLEERIKLKKSVSLAREVQQRLLPEELPQVSGLEVAGLTLYCDETGGDYYDVIQTAGPGSLLVAVADVSGHDVASALLMASTRALLRGAAMSRNSLAERVAVVNRLLTQDVAGSGHFVTLLCVEYEADSGEMSWVRAGHEPGWLFEPGRSQPVELGGDGLSLGFKATGVCAQGRRPFAVPGSVVVLCTDGVFEATDETGAFFGRSRFFEVVRKAVQERENSAGTIVRRVLEALDRFRGEASLADDVTVVAMKKTDQP
jgi:sigma-B regulation protein RsbU (phosphoserine phosphatase)